MPGRYGPRFAVVTLRWIPFNFHLLTLDSGVAPPSAPVVCVTRLMRLIMPSRRINCTIIRN